MKFAIALVPVLLFGLFGRKSGAECQRNKSLRIKPKINQEEKEFINLFNLGKDLLKGYQLKTLHDVYDPLPVEIKDLLSEKFMKCPNKLARDIFSLIGPSKAKEVVNLATNFGGYVKQAQGISDKFEIQLEQATQKLTDWTKTSKGKEILKLLPILMKARSIQDALPVLRIIEKETRSGLDGILKQIQDPSTRKMFVSKLVRPIYEFIKEKEIISQVKSILERIDGMLSNGIGFELGLKYILQKFYIHPLAQEIRKTFQIKKESLLDLTPEEIEGIIVDILTKEVLEPLDSIIDAFEKASRKSSCAQFIFCQLNQKFQKENFFKRYFIKISSIISTFRLNRDSFSGLYESIQNGADQGFDCKEGQSNLCLELMRKTSHDEL